MSHPGVGRQGYCYFCRDVVFPAKAGIYVTPSLRDSRSTPAYGQLNSRATPEVAEAHSLQSIKHIPPCSVLLRQLADVRHRGGDVDSGFRRNDGKNARLAGGVPDWREG